METINKLGEFLVGVRKDLKLSLNDVAQATKISASYINRLEKGNRCNPTIYILDQLSAFYKVSPQKVMELAGLTNLTKDDINEEQKKKMSNVNQPYSDPKPTAPTQDLSQYLNEVENIILGGKQVRSKTFQLIVDNATNLNMDNMSDVMNLVASIKQFQSELEKSEDLEAV